MFTLPDLPYAPNALEPFIDAQTMEIHHDKHHAAYVKNLNDLVTDKTEADLEDLLKTTDNQKIKNNGGGHLNHALFWQMMCPSTNSGSPTGKLLDAINTTFGSLEVFREKFTAAALGRFGSGWVWLVMDNGQLIIDSTSNQDIPKAKVLLGLDVWEHAYYISYKWNRAEYIKNWWNIVNWPKVAEKYNQI